MVYALVAILGLVTGGPMLLGLVAMNTADHWLHVALAVVLLAAGFMLRRTGDGLARENAASGVIRVQTERPDALFDCVILERGDEGPHRRLLAPAIRQQEVVGLRRERQELQTV